jgi:hypothetical protein
MFLLLALRTTARHIPAPPPAASTAQHSTAQHSTARTIMAPAVRFHAVLVHMDVDDFSTVSADPPTSLVTDMSCTPPCALVSWMLLAAACPLPAGNPRLGNGICDDELNTPACGWDKGDCE